jgi:hypothetical protein
VNCFEEELSQSLCSARKVEVLSLNGLRAAEGCTDSVVMPFSNVRLFNAIGGSLPACVWDFHNLTVLHLAGNGLSGELPQSLPAYSQISDVSLPHNQLSGTISPDVLDIKSLDLSYNKFAGEYKKKTEFFSDASLHLDINRMSGHLPVSDMARMSNGSLSILRGNMFSCNSIPANDNFSDDYICGSDDLNVSLFVFVAILGASSLLIVVAIFTRLSTGKHISLQVLQSKSDEIWTWMTFVRTLSANDGKSTSYTVRKVALLRNTFVGIMKNSLKLLIVILICSIPLYAVKVMDSSDAYATHSHTYAWFWTAAYMRGVVPACLLLVVWCGAISACFHRVVIHPRRSRDTSVEPEESEDVDATQHESNRREDFWDRIVPVGAAFIANACITISVNALYIYSTQQALRASKHFAIQLSLSIFRLLYVAVAFPLLSKPIKSPIENVRFRFILLTINNLLIPCIVTALTSDACFQVLTYFCILSLIRTY